MKSDTIAEAIYGTQAGPSSSVYAHPYYEPDRKGKGRQIDAQLDRIKEVKQSIALAQASLSRREGDWGKLARSLREIAGHSQALLPFPSSLPQPSPNRPIAPTRLTTLPPAELVDTLARELGLQVFSEDSQFGLLKQSLAIAGSSFVVDIDLETDAVPDDAAHAAPSTDASSGQGKVRLSKLEVNHVTADGGNEASPHIRDVLEKLVAAYIAAKYADAEGYKQERERAKEVQRRINALREGLEAVQKLDGATGSDSLFAALEEAAATIQALYKGQIIRAVPTPHILPTFTIHPSPINFTLRPSTSKGAWLLQPATPMPVSRNWLDAGLSTGDSYDGGVKLENLWYKDTTISDVTVFPYSSAFSHTAEGDVEQTWRLARPGPDGYLVNRVPVSDLEDGLSSVIRMIRRQLVLTAIVQNVFRSSAIAKQDEFDEDVDLDDLLNQPISIPLDVQTVGNGIEIKLPTPHTPLRQNNTLSLTVAPVDEAPFVQLRTAVSPHDESLRSKVQAAADSETNRARGSGQFLSLVSVISAIEAALRV